MLRLNNCSLAVHVFSCSILLALVSMCFCVLPSRITKCPSSCECKTGRLSRKILSNPMKIVNCSNSHLISAPENVSSSTEVLILSFNQIKRLNLPYTLRNMKHFYASSNKIYEVDRRIRKMTRLQTLDLHNNSLTHLENGIFSGLRDLVLLDLSKNHIHSIEKHAFGGLNHLRRIYLDGNKIMYLEKQWFISMPSLRWLYLSKNFIGRIEKNIFDTLSSLIMIKISNNQLRMIQPNVFNGLEGLRILDLSNNKLTSVSQNDLTLLPNLQYLYLDGNPILKIPEHAFDFLNLTMLTLSYMPELLVVEQNAFSNLLDLITLQLHDNPKLVFIDPHSFSNCPKLKNLYLHNNNLSTLSQTIKNSLPSLTNIHFYYNSLSCDCNAIWMKKELLREKHGNYTSVLYDDAKLKCTSPRNKHGRLLRELSTSDLNSSCKPKSLPLFQEHYNVSVGEELRLECHGIGIPIPQVKWRLPNGTVLAGSYSSGKNEIENNCSLILRYLRQSDSGSYTCVVENEIGSDFSTTSVVVNNKPIRLLPFGISGDYVTITWNGTSSQWTMITSYQIRYKELNSNENFKVIPLGRHTNRYTFTNLKPRTTYNFCIVYVFETELYTVDCENITTKGTVAPSGIRKVDSRVVIGVISTIFTVLIVVCGIVVTRRLGKKKDYLDNLSKETDSLTQIPLDNFYQPSSTPICSSRTSLIQSQD